MYRRTVRYTYTLMRTFHL